MWSEKLSVCLPSNSAGALLFGAILATAGIFKCPDEYTAPGPNSSNWTLSALWHAQHTLMGLVTVPRIHPTKNTAPCQRGSRGLGVNFSEPAEELECNRPKGLTAAASSVSISSQLYCHGVLEGKWGAPSCSFAENYRALNASNSCSTFSTHHPVWPSIMATLPVSECETLKLWNPFSTKNKVK